MNSLHSRIRAGEPEAFREIFRDHAQLVHRHAVRVTGDWSVAEDVVSLTFMEAWRRRAKLRDEGDSPRPWLMGISVNVLRNTTRAARRHQRALGRLPAKETVPDFADELVARLADADQLAAAQRALGMLRRSEREVFTLCVWSGLGSAEAAAAPLPRSLPPRQGSLRVKGVRPGAEFSATSSQEGPCVSRLRAATRISVGSLEENQPVGEVADPYGQEAVDHVRAELAQHGQDRLGIGEGEFLREVHPVVLVRSALGRRAALVAPDASGVSVRVVCMSRTLREVPASGAGRQRLVRGSPDRGAYGRVHLAPAGGP
ncbi:RNA polymerase sigma factor [Streptomyces sp. NPDC058304]|uniref:RNA polymerase sigma factor n=1 Tax=Streptomyces sp. NPDC058304 TaxID=3346437 RepID=UPI0036E7A790